jgi:nucleoside-diphosphate-sugar epimerase
VARLKRKVVVTGATGFLGSHLVRALVSAGSEVFILTRSTSNRARIADLMERLRAYEASDEGIEALFAEHAPFDAVLHTATAYDRNGEPFRNILDANVRYPLKLMECAAKTGTAVYINTDTFSSGSLDILPGYHLTKKQFTEWGKMMAETGRIRFLNVKLEHLYGPNDNPDKFVSYVIRSLLADIPELALTPGQQKRDFIYVDDAVAAYLTLLHRLPEIESPYREYSLGTGTATSIRAFVERAHAVTCSKTVLRFGALPYRAGEIMFSQGRPEALQALGWSHRIGLEEGIRSVMRSMLEGNRTNTEGGCR